jgi:hypothetical protein
MTTKRQVKALYQPLLKRYPELAMIETAEHGYMLVLRPVDHLVRVFNVQRSAYADRPDYYWSIGYTFWHKASLSNIRGTNFITPDIKMMYWSHPKHEEAFIEAVETQILPVLRSVDSIERLLSSSHPMEQRWKWRFDHPVNKMCLHAALGDFGTAAEAAREFREKGRVRMPWWSEETYVDVMERLWPLCEANDRAGVAALLHEWERRFIEKHKLQALHESRPFPIELQPST